MLRFLTAGESHGQALVTILEGMPAGLPIDFDAITTELRRRQTGYGRGRRMAIESDRAEILSGIRHGLTTGGPIGLLIPNTDWENWQRTMAVEAEPAVDASGVDRPVVTRPRPGHADLAGVVKYGHDDIRNILERASARETAARVAVGAIARQLLAQLETEIVSHVFCIGSASLPDPLAITFADARGISAESALHCVDADAERRMIAEIDKAREAGDTMGGAFEVIAHGVPPGLGSHVQWDRKLDGRLAQALMSIQGFRQSKRSASAVAHSWRRCLDRASTTRSSRRPEPPRWAYRVRRTTPAASKAASPTAKSCASPPT
jgi:chorismate synthase